MGTSGAYGGSGGPVWSKARRRARALSSEPSQPDIDRLLQAIGDGLPGAEDGPAQARPEAPEQTTVQPERETQPALATPTVSWGPISARPGGGGGDGPGGGAGRAAGRRGGSGSSRTSRSTGRAATIGGRVARLGAALVTGDRRTLAEFGLDLGALAGLTPEQQAQRIAAQIVVGDSIENAEMRAAADALLLAQIAAARPLTPVEAAQIYATAWVTEIVETELAAAYRDGARSPEEVRRVGRMVRDSIRAIVEGLVTDGMDTMDTEAVIREVLDRARNVMRVATRRRP